LDQLLGFVTHRALALVEFRVEGIVDWGTARGFASDEMVSSIDTDLVEAVSGIEHGGSNK
jgi:hypothetical protein